MMRAMQNDNQINIPDSFMALYLPAGRSKPTAGFAEILARYEFCEDMANLLTETAANMQFSMGITEADVLGRVHAGLLVEGSAFNAPEAGWVVQRLAELLNWPRVNLEP